eukprot:TRINITY_DN18797_c0_g1_i1.p1 TRINITY_DN18797_c0_g1~~TRINITY_DN18797_c0_g1_i1.p1  ORF type:complete len:140 (+),score=27.50 TRINITY_DN18797_c0_g1_i1:39-422(+)
MAASPSLFLFSSLIFFFNTFLLSSSLPTVHLGRKVGGWVKIKDVKTNKEVQDLGRFCVEEFNKDHNAQIKFSEVIQAEMQVVSGIKYHLKIVTGATGNGNTNKYDAMVVVKAWLNSKELLSFTPASS